VRDNSYEKWQINGGKALVGRKLGLQIAFDIKKRGPRNPGTTGLLNRIGGASGYGRVKLTERSSGKTNL